MRLPATHKAAPSMTPRVDSTIGQLATRKKIATESRARINPTIHSRVEATRSGVPINGGLFVLAGIPPKKNGAGERGRYGAEPEKIAELRALG
jgi:hypothetical protein